MWSQYGTLLLLCCHNRLDCDPGHDDMIAIILAAYAPGIKLLGISTTHGNVAVEKTTVNALRILKMAGIGM